MTFGTFDTPHDVGHLRILEQGRSQIPTLARVGGIKHRSKSVQKSGLNIAIYDVKMLQSTGGMTSKCYSQRGDQLLNLAFLLQSDEANQSQCCNALQSATVAQFDRNFRAMLFGYICLRF